MQLDIFQNNPATKKGGYLIKVAIKRPLFLLFSYFFDQEIAVGSRVLVDFGSGKKPMVGLVLDCVFCKQIPLKIKKINQLVDEKPLLSSNLIRLIKFVGRYYQAPIGEVAFLALPSSYLKNGNFFEINLIEKKPIAINLSNQPKLTNEQTNAINQISNNLQGNFLLEGVTGSGKTEVYLQTIAKIIQNGGQVLLLVPEIGLVEQMMDRLKARFGEIVAIHHSGLTDKKRFIAWQQIKSGEKSILLGTRSAIFYDFADLRAIIVDEEHDLSFKQMEKTRYNGRDLAIVRASFEKLLLILGTATPSLETLHRLKQDNWQRIYLANRVEDRPLPKVRLIDTKQNKGFLTQELISAIHRRLAQKEQVLLFLNRRGFAPIIGCESCDWQAVCPDCDTRLIAHLDKKKACCHHCGFEMNLAFNCADCGGGVKLIGLGTQRLEQMINREFPYANVLRIDSDVYKTALQFNQAIKKVINKEVDILLGTQWLSKGHHFAGVNLVGVLDIDSALYSHDFRSEERLAQLLVQIAGRAGRESKGEVLLQTSQTGHPIFEVFGNGYRHVADRLYKDRERYDLPPFCAQVLLLAQHKSAEIAQKALVLTKKTMQDNKIAENALWLGPVLANLARKAGIYRAVMLVQMENKKQLQAILPKLNSYLLEQGKLTGVKVMIDVDPMLVE